MSIKGLTSISSWFSKWLEVIAGTALIGTMLLTFFDIVGRALGSPVPGAYEIVSFSGGIVIGLAMPVTSQTRGHVMLDLLIMNVSERTRNVLHVITRVMVIILFLLLGYSFIKMGIKLKNSGEVSAVLSLPFYMVAYGLAGASFVECLILVVDMIKGGGEIHE